MSAVVPASGVLSFTPAPSREPSRRTVAGLFSALQRLLSRSLPWQRQLSIQCGWTVCIPMPTAPIVGLQYWPEWTPDPGQRALPLLPHHGVWLAPCPSVFLRNGALMHTCLLCFGCSDGKPQDQGEQRRNGEDLSTSRGTFLLRPVRSCIMSPHGHSRATSLPFLPSFLFGPRLVPSCHCCLPPAGAPQEERIATSITSGGPPSHGCVPGVMVAQ